MSQEAVEWMPLSIKAIWLGDAAILYKNAVVEILAVDEQDTSRMACWIRYWPDGSSFPQYRSCDITDLEYDDAWLKTAHNRQWQKAMTTSPPHRNPNLTT